MSEQDNQSAITQPITPAKQSLLKSIISGANGNASTARVATLIVISSATYWVTYCVLKTHAIPDLSGLALYVTSVVGVLYGSKKEAETLAAIKSNGPKP